jgi:hypothetical protein
MEHYPSAERRMIKSNGGVKDVDGLSIVVAVYTSVFNVHASG